MSYASSGLTLVTGSGAVLPLTVTTVTLHEHRLEAAVICQNGYNGLLPHGQANLIRDVPDTWVGGVGSTWVEIQ